MLTPPPKYSEKPVQRPFPCLECTETFINKPFLKAHTRSKHEADNSEVQSSAVENTFRCEQCDFSSIYKANLQRHHEKVHKKRKTVSQGPVKQKKQLIFNCDDCNYKFDYKCNVKKHVARMHQGNIY